MIEGIEGVNAYGYAPVGLEWDLWVSPVHPARMQEATVDHGTQGALVTQVRLFQAPSMPVLAFFVDCTKHSAEPAHTLSCVAAKGA